MGRGLDGTAPYSGTPGCLLAAFRPPGVATGGRVASPSENAPPGHAHGCERTPEPPKSDQVGSRCSSEVSVVVTATRLRRDLGSGVEPVAGARCFGEGRSQLCLRMTVSAESSGQGD